MAAKEEGKERAWELEVTIGLRVEQSNGTQGFQGNFDKDQVNRKKLNKREIAPYFSPLVPLGLRDF